MQIQLQSAITHICQSTDSEPIYSESATELSFDFREYLVKTIEKTFTGDDVKTCTFQSDSAMRDMCRNTHWDLVSLSRWTTEQVFRFMHQNEDISSGDLCFGIAQLDDTPYFFMLKFDYKTAFTHLVEPAQAGIAINMIQHHAILPTQPPKVSEAFFLDMNSPIVKLCEHKVTIDGQKAFYLSSGVLECTEAETPRQKANKVLRVAEKVADTYYNNPDEMDLHITTTLCEEFDAGRPLNVERLGQQFFRENEEARQDFYAKLDSAHIAKDEELQLSERYQKKFQKQTLNTPAGVEITIPTQLYGNTNEVEFINNPDGSVSLLIKNINL